MRSVTWAPPEKPVLPIVTVVSEEDEPRLLVTKVILPLRMPRTWSPVWSAVAADACNGFNAKLRAAILARILEEYMVMGSVG